MLFEDLLMLLLIWGGIFFVGIPIFKFIMSVIPKMAAKKQSSLEEAKQRFATAQADAEAAKLNKQTEKLYDEIYKETLENETEDEAENNRKSNHE